MNITQISGVNCCTLYQKENQTKFRDVLRVYIDGRVMFQRYCYGEAAGLVFDCWADSIDESGNINWVHEPEVQSRKEALPRKIERVDGEGAILIEGETKRYLKTDELKSDSAYGYGKLKLWLLKRKLQKALETE